MAEKCFDRGSYTLCIDKLTKKQTRHPKGTDAGGPTAIQKAANFTKAAVKHVATGRKHATLEVIQQRFSVCENCPSKLFAEIESPPKRLQDAGTVGTCLYRSCGCYIHDTKTFPNKLAWDSEKCPNNHWNEDDSPAS